ncbi:Spy/CpxP family protein refolding chaperone [Pseudomonas sp. RP23018S]|uniref:Spy/CpxP family protein refolding chaperone n=1 Tax=Pseudomonas sp. RP23018S TaxID=3096037 RepID=UPI002ACA0989|nr:Spy/CpxP family protein refolding chaperone [Pseudomonas sp. RP23018S]MDZ5602110.1 Spy/CpxP family protein refolding chaperone [Pseudomonas sp. RP23018S]
MRKTLTALLFAATLPTVAMAMPPEGGPRHDGPHRGGPFAQLDLTREQRQQVDQLMDQQRRADREIHERYLDKLPAAEKTAMDKEAKASREKTQSEIRGLLKPEQQKRFDELQKARDARAAEWQEFQTWKAEKAKKAQ